MRIERLDDLGDVVPLTQPVRRVASLSPSLTAVIRSVDPTLLVGTTHGDPLPDATAPDASTLDASSTDLGDPLAPDLRLVSRLVPDLVLASESENRPEDVRRLRDAGVSVWTCHVETVQQALHSVERLVDEGLGRQLPAWLHTARQRWQAPDTGVRHRAAVLLEPDRAVDPAASEQPANGWRAAGRNQLVSDLLAHHGVENVFASHRERLPTITASEIAEHHVDVVLVLADSPDRPNSPATIDALAEAVAPAPVRVLDRRPLTRFGPTLLDAAALLEKSFPHSTPNR